MSKYNHRRSSYYIQHIFTNIHREINFQVLWWGLRPYPDCAITATRYHKLSTVIIQETLDSIIMTNEWTNLWNTINYIPLNISDYYSLIILYCTHQWSMTCHHFNNLVQNRGNNIFNCLTEIHLLSRCTAKHFTNLNPLAYFKLHLSHTLWPLWSTAKTIKLDL